MKVEAKREIIEDESQFNQILRTTHRVMALIYATWCPFCRSFLPVFTKFTEKRDNLILVKDDEETIAEKYQVEVIPTVLCFEDGELIGRLDGTLGVGLSEKQLSEFVSSFHF